MIRNGRYHSTYVPPARLPALQAQIDEAAQAAGRDPSAVKRLYNVDGRISTGALGGFLDGPVDHWVEALASLALNDGIDTFVFWPREAPEEQLRRFAEEVVPLVRATVDRARGSRASSPG